MTRLKRPALMRRNHFRLRAQNDSVAHSQNTGETVKRGYLWSTLAPTLVGGLLAITGGLIASGFNARIDSNKVIRDKLELAYISVLETDSALNSATRDQKSGGLFADSNQMKILGPLNRIQMVGALYEPSLNDPIVAYTKSFYEIEAVELSKVTTESIYKALQDTGLFKSTAMSESQFAEKKKQRTDQIAKESSEAFEHFRKAEEALKHAISVASAKHL